MRKPAWQHLAPPLVVVPASFQWQCHPWRWPDLFHITQTICVPGWPKQFRLVSVYVILCHLLYMDQTLQCLCNIICLIFVHVYKLCEMRFMSPPFRLPTSRKIVVGNCRLMENVHRVIMTLKSIWSISCLETLKSQIKDTWQTLP